MQFAFSLYPSSQNKNSIQIHHYKHTWPIASEQLMQ